MAFFDGLLGWRPPGWDHARAGTFARFLWKRFLDDRLFQAAGALAFTTAFSIVPLSMVVFGILSAFPFYEDWSSKLSEYIFSNFVPSSAWTVRQRLFELTANAGKLTVVGVVALVISLLITLTSIEATFNRIWRVPTARLQLGRLMMYWTVMSFGGLLAAASLAVSARFFALSMFQTTPGQALETGMLRIAPLLIEFVAIVVIYRVVPHRTIRWRHAALGAVPAVLMIEAVKIAAGSYLGSFGTYEKLYGAIAVVPIFLGWIYFSWVAVLLGASLASSLSAFRYQPASQRLPPGYEIHGLLRLIGRFDEARRSGRGLHLDDLREREPILTDALVQQMLGKLQSIGLIARAESGEWLLARDLDGLTLGELYEACQLRIPTAEAWVPAHDDALGRASLDALDTLRVPLREVLGRSVASIYREESE